MLTGTSSFGGTGTFTGGTVPSATSVVATGTIAFSTTPSSTITVSQATYTITTGTMTITPTGPGFIFGSATLNSPTTAQSAFPITSPYTPVTGGNTDGPAGPTGTNA